MVNARKLAEAVWHDASGSAGVAVVDAVAQAIERERTEMVKNQLTTVEARVIWTVLQRSYAPHQYFDAWRSALVKLCNLGGNTYACRDCPNPAPHSSRLGGFVCAEHKAKEDAMIQEKAK
jgi:hypothetical protein